MNILFDSENSKMDVLGFCKLWDNEFSVLGFRLDIILTL